MGWAWAEILTRPCVYECLPSNLSQHFTKHAENHLTRTSLCLDPAQPCPLHNLLLFILGSELISSLFTFSGKHSPNTLIPCSSSLSCPLSKNYVPFLWNTYLACLCVFKCGCRALVNFCWHQQTVSLKRMMTVSGSTSCYILSRMAGTEKEFEYLWKNWINEEMNDFTNTPEKED